MAWLYPCCARAEATCGSLFGGGGVVCALAAVSTCAGASWAPPPEVSSPLSSPVDEDEKDEEAEESDSGDASEDESEDVVGAKMSSLSSSSVSPGLPVLLGPEGAARVVGVCVAVVVAVCVCVMVRTRCWPS